MPTFKLSRASEKPIRVGDLARVTGRCSASIRYWARRLGLKPRRSAGGYREFTVDEAQRIVEAIVESARKRPFARAFAEQRSAPLR
jgi:hypothetical protein